MLPKSEEIIAADLERVVVFAISWVNDPIRNHLSHVQRGYGGIGKGFVSLGIREHIVEVD